ncbi:MAG: permease [Bacillota bacterium]
MVTGMDSFFSSPLLQGFTTIFISIILEAIPFVMIGAFLSSIIQVFVSEQTIARFIPRSRVIGLVTAGLMGFIFPVCECAIVPIMRRLIKKGVPLYIAVTFMVAVPIVNPVVLASTYYAFSGQLYMPVLRGFLGFMGAILIGHLIGIIQGRDNGLREAIEETEITSHQGRDGHGHEEHHEDHHCGCGHHEHEVHIEVHPCSCEDHGHKEHHKVKHRKEEHCSCESHPHHSHDHAHHHQEEESFGEVLACGCGHDHAIESKKRGLVVSIVAMVEHASIELYGVGRFLIMGAFLSAMMQTLVERRILLSLGQDSILSIVVMMVLAFALSLCSEADAFIARTFLGQFTTGSIVGFLIFGPMIDIKNTLMLMNGFKGKFVAKLIMIITMVCFLMAAMVNFVGI